MAPNTYVVREAGQLMLALTHVSCSQRCKHYCANKLVAMIYTTNIRLTQQPKITVKWVVVWNTTILQSGRDSKKWVWLKKKGQSLASVFMTNNETELI